MKPDAVDLQELACGGIVVFRIPGQAAIHQGRYSQSAYRRGCSYYIRMRLGDYTAFMGKGFWRACPVGCGHHMHSKGVHEIQDDPRSVAAQKEQLSLRFVPKR